MEEKLYDENNASIILCDEALEEALNLKYLHLGELRENVCKQLTPNDTLPEKKACKPKQQTNNVLATKFYVKPLFREVLNHVSAVSKNQRVFTYEELKKHLVSYIMWNRERFFDERSLEIVYCGLEDPLGKAFSVKAFHGRQLFSLIMNQVIPYENEITLKHVEVTDTDKK
jgi:hypothetical protein